MRDNRPARGHCTRAERNIMKRAEAKEERRVIAGHLNAVVEDLVSYRNRLEEAGSNREAKKLDTAIGKIYDLAWILTEKGR